jgi:cystathionine beta-lyase family protein involved in aluminum resistance
MDKNNLVQNAEEKVAKYFKLVDEIKEYNQEKVLKAFYNNKIGLEHFATVSGYAKGYCKKSFCFRHSYISLLFVW